MRLEFEGQKLNDLEKEACDLEEKITALREELVNKEDDDIPVKDEYTHCLQLQLNPQPYIAPPSFSSHKAGFEDYSIYGISTQKDQEPKIDTK